MDADIKELSLEQVIVKASNRPPTQKDGCLGHWIDTPDIREYIGDYDTTIDCDDCKYDGGRKDPEAKRNQSED